MPTIGFSFKWNGAAAEADVRRIILQRLEEAGKATARKVKENIHDRGPPPSSPGEFPHQVTAELIKATFYKVEPATLKCWVGNTAEHAMPLEVGTRTMAARPFLRLTLHQMSHTIAAIMGRPIITSGSVLVPP